MASSSPPSFLLLNSQVEELNMDSVVLPYLGKNLTKPGIFFGEGDAGDEPEIAILFVGVSLFLGMACRHLLKDTRVPYTVALLVLGIAMGASEYGTSHGLGQLGRSIRLWSEINPKLILFVFLPALLFESSFAMDIHQIKRCLLQMILLAGPGVVISSFSLGVLVHYIFPYEWSWNISLLLGGLLSATDPVAVVALLKELGASKKMRTIIEGESLMNDGTAIVIFRLFYQMVFAESLSPGKMVEYLSRVCFGSIAVGLVFGLVCVLWLARIFNDTVMEITLTLTASYLAFYTAEDDAGVSGVLTVMTVGMFFAAFARTAFKGESQQSMHHFWEMVSYIANTLIFILSGVVIAESILRSKDQIEGMDWAYLVLLYIFLQVSRALVVATLYPGLRYFGYGMNWKEATILIWAGLRGAVALSLSLSVKATNSSTYSSFSRKTEARFVFMTGGVVLLTLIINGSTTQFLLHYLRMEKASETKLRILEYTKHEMNRKALEAFGDLKQDEELGPAEWMTLRKYIRCLNVIERESQPKHPHAPGSFVSEFQNSLLQDTRIRFLSGVQSAYWNMLEEGRITQAAANVLMQSVDEALDDVVKHGTLLDWEGLSPSVQFPHYLKSLQLLRIMPRKLRNYLLVHRLELGCYISAAFLRAHRYARHQLRQFIGESEIAETVIRESEAEEGGAKQFLEDVRITFPEVLRAVKTRQVTYGILIHLNNYIQSLENSGLLDEREKNHLHYAIQADFKKLLRNPPNVKVPTASELLNNYPLLGALPSAIQEPLILSAKEFMKMRDTSIYEEGSRADGIWLIANGAVKWNKKHPSGKHLIHPTFSHGSTLGLYEVLSGRPYLCNVTADSFVHCFFIDSLKILSASKSSVEIEEFLWQESALAIAKILVPQYFEQMTMQEMRVLILQGSEMRIFLPGEIVEIHPFEVGILLEGFMKQQGKYEIITAPSSIMFPSRGSYSESLTNHRALYHAETHSRLLVIDLKSHHSELHRSSKSLLGSNIPLNGQSSHEMDSRILHKHNKRNSSDVLLKGSPSTTLQFQHRKASSKLLVKALQLDVFGSKVKGLSKSWKSGVFSHSVEDPQRSSMLVSPSPYGKRFWSTSVLQNPQLGPHEKPHHSSFSPYSGQGQGSKAKAEGDSDSSDGEDEHIIRIDSLSFLFNPPSRPSEKENK